MQVFEILSRVKMEVTLLLTQKDGSMDDTVS